MSRFAVPAAPAVTPITGLPEPWSPRLTQAEQTRRNAAEKPQGFLASAVDSAKADWVTSDFFRMLDRTFGTDHSDPTFTVTDDLVKRLGEGIPDSQWSRFWSAQSYDEAAMIRDQLIDVNAARQRVAKSTSPFLAPLATGLVDPAYLLAGAATGGAAPAIKAGLGGSRLAGLAARGIVDVGLTMAPLETFRATQNPDDDLTKSMIHGTIGLIGMHMLGKGVGSAWNRGMEALGKRVELGDAVNAGMAQPGSLRSEAMAFGGGHDPNIKTPQVDAVLGRMRVTDAAKEMLAKGLIKNPEYFADQIGMEGTPHPETRYVEHLIDAAGLDPVHHAEDIAALREHAADLYDATFRDGSMTPPEAPRATGEVPTVDPAADLFAPKQPKPKPEKGGGEEPPTEKPRRERLGDFFPTISDAWSARGKLLTIVGRVGRSESAKFRETINALLSDPLAKYAEKKGGRVVPSYEALDEWTSRTVAQKQLPFLGEYNQGYAEWFKDNGFPASEIKSRRADFNTLLVHAIQDDPGKFTKDVHINRVADATRKMLKDQLDFMHDHYVAGVENVQTDGKYYPNQFKAHLLEAAEAKYPPLNKDGNLWKPGDGEKFSQVATKLIGPALNEKYIGALSPEKRQFIADVYLQAIRDSQRLSLDRGEDVTQSVLRIVEKKLRQKGMKPDQINDILYEARGEDAKKGPMFLQKRIDLDRNFSADLINGETGGHEKVSIADFIDQNFDTVIGNYFDKTTRLAGMSKFLRKAGEAHGFPEGYSSFDDLRSEAIREAEDAVLAKKGVINSTDRAIIQKHSDLLGLAHDRIMGRAIEDRGLFGQSLAILRNYAHAVYSGGFGLAQIPDLGKAVAIGGIDSFARHMPAFAETLKAFRAGKATTGDLRVIDRIIAADTEPLHRAFAERLDDSATMLDRIERQSRNVSNLASDLAGVGNINRVVKRNAGLMAMDRLTDIALSGKIPNDARLGQWGLDKALMGEISAALKDDTLSHWMNGESGTKVRVPDLAKWDPQLAGQFTAAIGKMARSASDEFSLGSSAGWMNTNVGRSMMQFRTFHFQSWEKRLLASLQAHDFEAASGLAYSTMLGALTYMAQQYVKSLTLPADQRQAYRDDKLSTESIAAAAFARNGVSSLLPAAYDQVSHFTGGKPLFADARYSGLKNEFAVWESNPTLDMLHNVGVASSRALGPVRDAIAPESGNPLLYRVLGSTKSNDDFDQSASKAIFQLMPFRRHIVAQQFYDLVNNQFPEHERGR